jgi:hypothetical protein
MRTRMGRAEARAMWEASRPLTAVGAAMLGVAALSLAGIAIDPRTITGAPAWLKPFKFAVSVAIYCLTLAWIFTRLTDWPRVRRVVGWTTAVTLVLEVVIIAVQAWRGTTSHFNTATLLDGALFTVMGAAIMVQTLVSVAVAVVLWRQRFSDAPLGWALRLGMTLTIVGAMSGGLMTRPTAAQLEIARAGGGMAVAGAHTVGAPDGGAGVPVTGWSRTHGDLRVPHFIGLHALQVLLLAGLAVRRVRRSDTVRVRLVQVAGASYALLFAVLLWSALRGLSVIAPDALTVTALGLWAAATVSAFAWIGYGAQGTVHAARGVPA